MPSILQGFLSIPFNKLPWYQPFLVFALGKVAVCTSMFWQLWSFRVVQEGLKWQGMTNLTDWRPFDDCLTNSKCLTNANKSLFYMKRNSLKSWNGTKWKQYKQKWKTRQQIHTLPVMKPSNQNMHKVWKFIQYFLARVDLEFYL